MSLSGLLLNFGMRAKYLNLLRLKRRYGLNNFSSVMLPNGRSEEDWIEKIFKPTFPNSPRNEIWNEAYTIINKPEVTMRHPLIDLDAKIIGDEILSLKDEPDYRLKCMYAIVTGIGRGKTRLLVELDKYFKSKENIISTAITFNHNSGYISRSLGQPDLNYGLSIVARILSTHYRMPFPEVELILSRLLSPLKDLSQLDTQVIIRSCIRYIVRQRREQSNGVDRFILLVDESRKVEEALGDKLHNHLRKALLDTQIMAQHEEPLLVDLVMSSLDIQSTGVSDSDRPIISISTPEFLDAREVLEKWIKPAVPSLSLDPCSVDELKLLALISCFSPIPRTIQLLVHELQLMVDVEAIDAFPRAPLRLDASKVKELYSRTVEAFRRFYMIGKVGVPSPSAQQMKAILFKEFVNVDDSVLSMIKYSMLTNSIGALRVDATLIPHTSIVSIQSTKTDIRYLDPIHSTIKNLLSYLGSPVQDTGTENVGKPLEIIVRGVMNARLQVLKEISSRDMVNQRVSLANLFQLSPISDFEEESNLLRGRAVILSDVLFYRLYELEVCLQPSGIIRVVNLPNSHSVRDAGNTYHSFSRKRLNFLIVYMYYTDNKHFLTKSNEIVFDAITQYFEVKLHSKDFADACWFLRFHDTHFVLFVDCKSAKISSNSMEARPHHYFSVQDLPSRGSQALRVADLAEKLRSFDGLTKGSFAEAVSKGNYLYVYLDTHPTDTYGVGDHILHIGNIESNKYLSFFREFYNLHRLASTGASKER